MEDPAGQTSFAESHDSTRPWVGIFHWILTHRPSRLVVPPLILVSLLASLMLPLLKDLQLLSEDGLTLIEQRRRSATGTAI